MSQTHRTLQDAYTTLPASEVLQQAKRYFALQNGIYTAFIDMEGPHFVSLRGQGGEEIAIGVSESEKGTRVTASTYLFDAQVAQFLSRLPRPNPLDPASSGNARQVGSGQNIPVAEANPGEESAV